MTIDQILRSLEDRNLTVVSENTGISTMTLYRLKSGRGTPTTHTLTTLERYLRDTAAIIQGGDE